MKIVYITEVNLDTPSGVLHKLNQQVEAWQKSGHEVHVISFPTVVPVNNSHILLTALAKTCFVYRNDLLSKCFSNSVFNFLNKIFGIRKVKKYIFSINPDIIYIREMIAFPRINEMFGDFPVVMESNTLLEKELKFSGYKLRLFYNMFQNLLNTRIDGFIGVTDEISESYAKYKKPYRTIGNSIYIDETQVVSRTVSDSIKLIFVGTPGCEWHGVDKFVTMAKMFPKYEFYLVGPKLAEVSVKNIHQVGFLDKEELYELYKDIDVAVGTLALHRNGMKQACPLKVREYLSFGIPTIISYQDFDISNQEFILNLENIESCIEDNQDEICQFIEKWKGRRVSMKTIYPLISTEVKESLRLKFMSEIANVK